jgi:hypothetical protein
VSNVKARINGWKTRVFFELKTKQTRLTSSAEGLWKGYIKNGESDYFIQKTLSYVFFRMLRYLSRKNFHLAFAYTFGYFRFFVRKEKRLADKQVIEYFHEQHLKDVIKSIIRKTI